MSGFASNASTPQRLNASTVNALPQRASCLNASTPQRLNASTPQRLNASTPQRLNASTPQRLNASTPQRLNASTPQRLNASTPQRLNASTPQRLNASTPQRLNASTPQRLNASTPQRLNASTPQRLNASTPQRLNASTPQRLNASTPQRLNVWCGVVMAMFALYQAARRYAIRCLRRVFRFDPATICLALAFVFSTAVGAMAQDTTKPTGTITALGLAQNNHDGMTPINFQVVFDEPVSGFTADDIDRNPWNVPDDEDKATHTATISKFMVDSTNSLIYTFTLTPGVDSSGSGSRLAFTVSIPQDKITDAVGNKNRTIRGPHLTYSAPSANTPPVAHAGVDQTKRHGELVTLDGSGSMDKEGEVTYSWARTGVITGITVNLSDTKAEMPTFTANAAPGTVNVVHIFTLTVTDNEGATDTDTVTVVILSPFLTLTANAGVDQEVVSGAKVTLDGSASIVDGRISIAQYSWARTGGTTGATATLSNTKVAKPTFTADTLAEGAANVEHIFTLTVTDSEDNTDTDTVKITVTAPVPADTTRPRVSTFSQPLTHDGMTPFDAAFIFSEPVVGFKAEHIETASQETHPSYVFSTSQPLYSNLRQDPNNERRYTFTVTPRAPLWFKIGISENKFADAVGNLNRTFSTSQINYSENVYLFPVADTGLDQTVASGATVTLDGGGSTGTGDLFYMWIKAGTGTHPTLSNGGRGAVVTFTAPTLASGAADVILSYELGVVDNLGFSDKDTVTITVEAPDAPRVAAAGDDQTVAAGATVTLDGSGSTVVNGPISEYNWTRESGTSTRTTVFTTDGGGATNQRATSTPTTTFVADSVPANGAAVTHVIALRVLDADGIPSPKDEVKVTVNPNQLPTANAGVDRSVDSGVKVMLEGSGTDSDSDATLTYSWAWTSGTGASVPLTDADKATASFTANALTPGAADATHTFTLTVTDNNGESSTDTVTITVTSNAFPVATVTGGDQTVDAGASVEITGSGTDSDSDDEMLTYAWVRTGGTGNAAVALTGENTATLSFTADTLEAGARDVTHILELVVTDDKGAESAPVEVTITIESAIAVPVARAVTAQPEYASGATVTLDGSGSTVDFRKTPKTHAWVRTGGTGASNLALTNADKAEATFTADTLAAGAPDVTHTFTLTVRDSDNREATDTVEVTINAPFADPVASAVITGGHTMVASGGTVMLDGSGSTKDRRRTIATYAWTGETSEVTASLTSADEAVATFTAETLTAGAPDVTHTFTLTVTDSAGASDTAMVTITVTSNALPVATVTGGNQTVDAGAAVEITGSGTDSDSDDDMLTYAWVRTGGNGNAAVALTGENTATLSFTADTLEAGARDVTHIFELVVTDDKGAESAPVEVTITIESAIAVPVARAVTAQPEYASGATVTLDGSGSTVDFRKTPKTHAWVRTGGTGASNLALTNADKAEATFTADTLAAGAPDVTHTFTLTVRDSDNREATDTVEVTINAPFADPVASAVITGGHTMVASGGTVMLDGSGSTKDRRRTIATYAWTGETSEVTASLTSADEAVATFTAETLTAGAPDVTHTFTLTVTDSAGASDTAMVTITVTSNALPVATVTGGNQTVDAGAAVEITGSGTDSDSDDDMLTYAWVRTGGNGNAAVALTGENTATLSFTADTLEAGARDVTHILELVVTDDKGAESAPVEVTITIESAIAVPVARAVTAQPEYASGATVTLDGSGSTVDFRKTPKTHAWVRTGGTGASNLALTNADKAEATFTADTLVAGAPDVTHTFTLTVRDSDNREAIDTVEVTINAPFADPVASAVITGGHTMVASGGTVMLDGSGSTKDRRRTIATYAWTGETSEVTASLTSADEAVATFTAETLTAGAPDVTHTFTLTVTDSAGASDTAMVTITVTSNALPVATVTGGNQTVDAGAAVEITGSGTDSDSDDDMLTYAWVRTGGTGNAAVALTGENTATLSFTADTLEAGARDVTHILELVVTDDKGAESAPVEVIITIESAIADPVARAVTAQPEYASGATVTLDGSGSTVDFRKTPKTHAWTRTGGTGASNLALTNADKAEATFTADTLVAGAPDVTHTFTLTVRDSDNREAIDTVEVTINAPFADPVASAVITGGHTMVASGETVMLDGSGSTKDRRRTIATYAWTGETSEVTASLTSADEAVATFTADTLIAGAPDVTHTFTLTVTDSAGASDTATVTITVNSNDIPVATVTGGNQTVDAGAEVTLTGSGTDSDSDDDMLTYAWVRTGGNGNAAVALTGEDTATLSFTADTLDAGARDVTHIFELVVTDDKGTESAPVEVTITAIADPVARAVTAQPEYASGAMVTLDGSGSTVDFRKTPKTHAWTRTGGTGASNLALTNADKAEATFTADTLVAGAPDA